MGVPNQGCNMAIRLPSYLHRNRHGILYFRLTIPSEYRPYIGVSELYRSLGTASIREASPIAQSLYSALRRVFSTIDAATMPKHKTTPHEPFLIDPERLQETLRHAKTHHRLIDRIEELEQVVANLRLQSAQQQTQHKRELGIAIRTAAVATSATPTPPATQPPPLLLIPRRSPSWRRSWAPGCSSALHGAWH